MYSPSICGLRGYAIRIPVKDEQAEVHPYAFPAWIGNVPVVLSEAYHGRPRRRVLVGKDIAEPVR